jgi:predicted MFS family arabinose efflux permease
MLRPGYLVFGLFLLLAWFTFQGIDGLVTFYMSNTLGASEVLLGTYGTIKGVGMVLGAAALSGIASRFSLKTAALVTLALVSVGGFALSFCTTSQAVLLLGVLLGIVAGLQWSVYGALSMGITDLRIAGSMFALFQMMVNIGIAAGEGVATSLSAKWGFTRVFVVLAAGNMLLIPLFSFVSKWLAAKRAEVQAAQGEAR